VTRQLSRRVFLRGVSAAVDLSGLTVACGTSGESGGSTASPGAAISEPVHLARLYRSFPRFSGG
jgi:hypothetical protein